MTKLRFNVGCRGPDVDSLEEARVVESGSLSSFARGLAIHSGGSVTCMPGSLFSPLI